MPLTNKDILELRQRKAYDRSKPMEPRTAPLYHHEEFIKDAECCATCRYMFADLEDDIPRCSLRRYETPDGLDYVAVGGWSVCQLYATNE